MATELRRDRREKQKRQRQRQQQRRRGTGGRGRGIANQLVMGGVVIGAIVLVILGLRAAGVFEPPALAGLDPNAPQYQVPAGATIGTLQPDEGTTHIPAGQTGSWNTLPPTSGVHWSSSSPAAPAPWGIKDTMLRNEVTVHNLEHGGIVIGYNNLSPAEVDQLKSIVRALSNGAYRKIILEPYPPLTDAKIALTAWRWLLKLDTVDQVKIVQFVRSHHADPNYAPEATVP